MTTGIDGNRVSTAGIGGARPAPVDPGGGRSRGTGPASARVSTGGGERVQAAEIGRFYEARGRELARAVRVRQLDRSIGRVQAQAEEVRTNLQAVKLYPPYPLDEPRRAAAIRQFNGVAREVARLVGHQTPELQLAPLGAEASTEEAEQALADLGRVGEALAGRRAELAHRYAALTGGEVEVVAQSESHSIGRQLAAAGGTGLAREAGVVLGQLS